MKTTLLILLSLISFSTFATTSLMNVVDELLQARKGIVIMDLDETVLDTHSRKYHAYLKAHEELCGKPSESVMSPRSSSCERSLGLSKIDFYRIENGYSSQELMSRLNITDNEFIKSFNKMMVESYLSSEWVHTDSPIPGANSFVRVLKRHGAKVFFVSSRYQELQLEETIKQLKKLGFIEGHETDTIILRKQGQDSLTFKRETVERIKKISIETSTPVIGLFENEPENMNAWKKVFPNADAYLIKGNILVPTELDKNVLVIDDYRSVAF